LNRSRETTKTAGEMSKVADGHLYKSFTQKKWRECSPKYELPVYKFSVLKKPERQPNNITAAALN